MPLNYIPLIDSRRYGTVSYRARLVAMGDAQPREGETFPDLQSIERSLLESEIGLIISRRNDLVRVASAATAISEISVEFAGYENQISLDKLKTLCEDIAAFLDRHIADRDPSAALNPVATEAIEEDGDTASDAEGLDPSSSSALGGAASKLPGSLQKRADANPGLARGGNLFRHI